MKLKKLAMTEIRIGEPPLLERFSKAKQNNQVEFGVFYSAERPGQVGENIGNVVLFKESHHTDKDVKIAAARINSLYFCDRLCVADTTPIQTA